MLLNLFVCLQASGAAVMVLLVDQCFLGQHYRFWRLLPSHFSFSGQSNNFFNSELHLAVDFIEVKGCLGNLKSSIF